MSDRIVLHVETPGGDEETRGFVWQGSPITLGRHQDRDLRLHGHHASRLHASIVRDGTGWLIADQSQNGTTLNGSSIPRATPTALDDGDRLVIAGTVIRVEIASGEPPHTVMLRPPSTSGTEPITGRGDGSHPGVSGASGAPGTSGTLATPPPPVGPALEVVRDGRVVREVSLAEGCSITLGRDATCDVVIPDPGQLVSSLHAQVDWNWSGLVVLDHSTNGLYLDGVRVDVCEPLADAQVMSFATDAPGPGTVTVRVRRPGTADSRNQASLVVAVHEDQDSDPLESRPETIDPGVSSIEVQAVDGEVVGADHPVDPELPLLSAGLAAAGGSRSLLAATVGAIVLATSLLLGLMILAMG